VTVLLKKDSLKGAGSYVGISALSILILFLIMKLWRADLTVPFIYEGDAVFNAMTIKTMIDNGWYLRNPFIGMPTGALMYDFTGSDNLHLLIIKLISLFSSDWAWVMNIFFILTFPLTALSSFYVFRKGGISHALSIAGSLLYTFLPYHFIRGELHLFLASYYMIPLMVMIIMRVASGEILFSIRDLKSNIANRKLMSGVFVCLLAASSGVYYAFFACLFLLGAGTKAWWREKSLNALLASLVLVITLLAGVLLNLSPALIYQYKNGKNALATVRYPMESELYGLKVTHLLLPVDKHRISGWAKIKGIYSGSTLTSKEHRSSSLGMIGSIGFLILILGGVFGWLRFLNDKRLENLGLLNIVGVLYTTLGGFGALFALVYPQFRGLNRMSVFIGFFSLFAVLILLERMKKGCQSLLARSLFHVFIGTMIVLGILDQTTEGFVQPYDAIKTQYGNDAKFVRELEALLPEGAMVFQLPNAQFPGGLQILFGRDHLKGYLHSKKLRWSYGTMMGREGDYWARWVSSKPVGEFVEIVSLAGFSGIWVDRNGYPDNGAGLEAQLKTLLSTQPIVSPDNRLAFYDARELGRKLEGKEARIGKATLPSVKKLQPSSLIPETRNIAYSFDLFTQNQHFVDISGWAFINGENAKDAKIYVTLNSGERSYLFNTNSIKRPDVTAHFKSLNLDDSGFSTLISKEEIERGAYRVGICIIKDKIVALQYVDIVLKIER
jgi:hypothetical protein